MDLEIRRRWIQTQQQKLEDIRSRKLTPTHHLRTDNIRLSKTKKIIQLKQPSICVYFKRRFLTHLFQQSNEDIGFKTFTEMMKTNFSWLGKVDQLNPLKEYLDTQPIYKSKALQFMEVINNVMRIRECYCDVRLFNPAEKQWILLKRSGDLKEGRRNHIPLFIGKYFSNFGCSNSYGKVLNDACGLNLENNKWSILHIENQFLEGVFDDASASFFNGEVKWKILIFLMSVIRKKEIIQLLIKKEYTFLEEECRMEMLQMIQDSFSLDSNLSEQLNQQLNTCLTSIQGQVPVARYFHSLNYFYHLNAFIIYGGRNDSKEGNILDDLYFLQLMKNWVLIQQMGAIKYGKCSHYRVSIDSKSFIFGDYTQNVETNPEIQLIELDQHKVEKIVKENKINNQMMITILDLLTNANLKVFKTELYQETTDLEQNETQKPFDTMKMSSLKFKIFMPLPSKITLSQCKRINYLD